MGVKVGIAVLGIAVVGVGGDEVGFAKGVFVGVFVGVEVGIAVLGIAVVGVSGDNVGFAEGVSVGGPDLITISFLSVSLNTPLVTTPFLISGQVLAAH